MVVRSSQYSFAISSISFLDICFVCYFDIVNFIFHCYRNRYLLFGFGLSLQCCYFDVFCRATTQVKLFFHFTHEEKNKHSTQQNHWSTTTSKHYFLCDTQLESFRSQLNRLVHFCSIPDYCRKNQRWNLEPTILTKKVGNVCLTTLEFHFLKSQKLCFFG